MTWHLAEDSDGDPTLWYGNIAVLRPTDLRVTTSYQRYLYDVLTRVLAPDEATVERLAHTSSSMLADWVEENANIDSNRPQTIKAMNRLASEMTAAVLAALAAAPDPDGGQREGVSGP